MKNLRKILFLLLSIVGSIISSCGTSITGKPTQAIGTTPTANLAVELTVSPRPTISTATRTAPQTYSKVFEMEIAEYQVSNEKGYEILTVPKGQLKIDEGCPVLPFVEVGALDLPYNASIIGFEIIDSKSSTIGTYNIPIADIAPFSEGGISYRENTEIDYFYPSEIVFSENTSTGWVLYASPIQHNPATDETLFDSYLKIRVTYEAPIPVALAVFSTDKSTYTLGDVVNTSTRVENVSTSEVSLMGVLILKDEFGQVVGSKRSEIFLVPPGQSYTLSISWEQPLEGGVYDVIITIMDAQENAISAASQNIQFH